MMTTIPVTVHRLKKTFLNFYFYLKSKIRAVKFIVLTAIHVSRWTLAYRVIVVMLKSATESLYTILLSIKLPLLAWYTFNCNSVV